MSIKTHCVPTRVGHCWSESTWSPILEGGRACTTCQVYPFLILDLFSSNPLVVLGRFHGKFPWSINVVNILPDQTVLIPIWDVEVLSSESPRVPLSKVSYNLFHLKMMGHYNGHVDATLKKAVHQLLYLPELPIFHGQILELQQFFLNWNFLFLAMGRLCRLF